MRSIDLMIAGRVRVVIKMHPHRASLLRTWRKHHPKRMKRDELPSAYTLFYRDGQRGEVHVHLCQTDKDIHNAVVHESVHAADEAWRRIRRCKDMKCVDGEEFRAYLVADLYILYRNCQRYGWVKSKKLFEGMVLPEAGPDFKGFKK